MGRLLKMPVQREILSDDTVIERANLKETSIFHLAERVGVNLELTTFYMQEERRGR